MKSFYNFLNDGGLGCSAARFFWKNMCPKKINLFNQMVWKDKILSLENLVKRRCNRLPTDTCVLCHSGTESVDHLFIKCPFAQQVWDYFVHLLPLPDPPPSMSVIWRTQRSCLRQSIRDLGDLVVKTFVWNICLVRNNCIFNVNVVSAYILILKINRMLLSQFSATTERSQAKLEDSIAIIRRSLDFLGRRMQEIGRVPSSEEGHDQGAG